MSTSVSSSSLTGVTLNVTSGTPPDNVGTQTIPVSSLSVGANSVKITDSSILDAIVSAIGSGTTINYSLSCSYADGKSVVSTAGTPYPLLLPVPNFFRNPTWVNTSQSDAHLEFNGWSLSSNFYPHSGDQPLRSILFDYSDLANNSSFTLMGYTKYRRAVFAMIGYPLLIRIVSPVKGTLTRVDLYGTGAAPGLWGAPAKNVEVWCASSDHGMTPNLTTQATKVGDLVLTSNKFITEFDTLNITPPISDVKVLYIKFLNTWGGSTFVATGGIRPYLYV